MTIIRDPRKPALPEKDEVLLHQDPDGEGTRPVNPADDVATLYSWANLHGAKYRDFSGARQEVRAQMRQRALAEQAQVVQEETRQQVTSGEEVPKREEVLSNSATVEAAAAEPAVPGTTLRKAEPPADKAPERNPSGTAERRPEPGPRRESQDVSPEFRAVRPAPEARSAEPGFGTPGSVRNGWSGRETARLNGRGTENGANGAGPAWLAERKTPAAGESLQQSRERVASRWFALQEIFGPGREEPGNSGGEERAPALTMFSLAGGAGKSTLVATLGRALAGRGERVLLTDACPFGLLPFYFGARDVRPGVVRTFEGAPADPPVRVLSLDALLEGGDGDGLRREIARAPQDVNRVLIDVPTASVALMRQAMRLSPTVLVPVAPDMASMMTLDAVQAFFRTQESAVGRPVQAWYLLNQFDRSVPLHLDLREVMRERLGERLLPFAVHRNLAYSEALAEGMTVVDYAPNSPAVEDLMNLVTWVRSASGAAAGGHRGARWSER